MKPTYKSEPRPGTSEEEVDLGKLFYNTGGVLNRILTSLKRTFSSVFEALLSCLFFLRRNLLWLILGTAIGTAYGVYLVSKYGSKYTADLMIKANFNSARSLYGTIDYLNSAISSSKIDELSKVLKISPQEASSLIYFEAEPVKSEIITSELYQKQFFNYGYRKNAIRMDTFWTRTINYKDFTSSLTKYDYPLHEIMVTSTNASVFSQLQQGIIDKISSNEFLQQINKASAETNKQTIDLITSSIQGIDTLRTSYNKRIAISPIKGEGGNSLTLMDGTISAQAPELELYDKLLELKDELKAAKKQAVVESNIIQVYSPFNPIGKNEKFFQQSAVKYGINGLVITFILLVGIAAYKFLHQLEKKRNIYKRENTPTQSI